MEMVVKRTVHEEFRTAVVGLDMEMNSNVMVLAEGTGGHQMMKFLR